MTPLLCFEDYGFKYAGSDQIAMSGVSLDLPAGKVVAVITPQGRGKTTFLRAAAGLLGEIFQGEATGRLHAPSERPGAFFDGYVQVTLAVETVREEIALPLYAMGVARVERDARVDAVARELRIEHLLERNVTALSGGEEKLVGIAAALVADTSIHILDEPFEQLDVAHLAAVIRTAKLRARAGRLVLIAAGSVDTALNIADAAVVLDGDEWKLIDRPTYADVAGIAGLGTSTLSRFLAERHANADGVRRFRDGVAKIA